MPLAVKITCAIHIKIISSFSSTSGLWNAKCDKKKIIITIKNVARARSARATLCSYNEVGTLMK